MPFLILVLSNLRTHRARSLLTMAAVAMAIMTVFTLGVLTHSLRQTAISILRTGNADFTVGQKGVADVLYSSLDEQQVARLQAYPGVESAMGVLIAPRELDNEHPFFLFLGLQPEQMEGFGVQVVDGRAYTASATDEIMLGYRAARDLGKAPGDALTVPLWGEFKIVGLFSTGQVFGDSAAMMALPALQAYERKPGNVTLAFVRVTPGTDIERLRRVIDTENPELATVITESDFGRVDRNLKLISAANTGATILALIIGAVGVMNTTVMSVFERTREFGVLRAIGWSRGRVLSLVMGEAVVLSLAGGFVGLLTGFVLIKLVQRAPDLIGVFQPDYPVNVFGRALGVAIGMAFAGAFYPAVRAAFLRPLEALRHE